MQWWPCLPMSVHHPPSLVVQGGGPQLLLRCLWLRRCRLALRPLLVCLAYRIASREVPLQGFCPSVHYLSYMVPVASALVAQKVPVLVLLVALCSVASGEFFPHIRGFRASLVCLCLGYFCACNCLPWLRLWCYLLAPSACPALGLSPAVAGLAVFR